MRTAINHIIAWCLLIVLAGFYSSCTTRRACDRKFPPTVITKDSVIERTTISYRDTTIRDTVPGEKVTVFIPTKIGASSKSKGHVHLNIKPVDGGTQIECIADSLFREIDLKNKEIDRLRQLISSQVTERVVTQVPWWAWVIMGVGFMGTVLYIIRLRTGHE